MKKDKEWLKKEMDELFYYDFKLVSKKEVLNLIDQLDEPEKDFNLDDVITRMKSFKYPALKEHWLHELNATFGYNTEVKEKPVIPKYVADYLENKKPEDRLLIVGYEYHADEIESAEVEIWIGSNPELFARACLDGYTVEEKKHKVLIGKSTQNDGLFLNKNRRDNVLTLGSNLNYFYAESNNDRTHLSEEEIKSFKDGIYWAFAEEVTE